MQKVFSFDRRGENVFRSIRNEKGFVMVTGLIACTILFLFILLLSTAGMSLGFRHVLQTACDAGSLAGVHSESTYIDYDEAKKYIDGKKSVTNAFEMIYTNLEEGLLQFDTKLADGTIATDASDTPFAIITNIVARPLSNIEFETRITGKVYLIPLKRYSTVHVISRTKLREKK